MPPCSSFFLSLIREQVPCFLFTGPTPFLVANLFCQTGLTKKRLKKTKHEWNQWDIVGKVFEGGPRRCESIITIRQMLKAIRGIFCCCYVCRFSARRLLSHHANTTVPSVATLIHRLQWEHQHLPLFLSLSLSLSLCLSHSSSSMSPSPLSLSDPAAHLAAEQRNKWSASAEGRLHWERDCGKKE